MWICFIWGGYFCCIFWLVFGLVDCCHRTGKVLLFFKAFHFESLHSCICEMLLFKLIFKPTTFVLLTSCFTNLGILFKDLNMGCWQVLLNTCNKLRWMKNYVRCLERLLLCFWGWILFWMSIRVWDSEVRIAAPVTDMRVCISDKTDTIQHLWLLRDRSCDHFNLKKKNPKTFELLQHLSWAHKRVFHLLSGSEK